MGVIKSAIPRQRLRQGECAEQATDGHSDQHARGSMLAGSRSRLRSSMSSQYRVLRAPSGSRVQSVDGGRVQPRWQIASPRQRAQRQITDDIESAARADSATCLPCLRIPALAEASQRAASATRCDCQTPAARCYLLHSFGAASQRHADRLGRLRVRLREVIRRWAHVGSAGPDAISTLCARSTAASPSRASP